jgi:type IV secretion system protein TrbE
MLLPERRSRRSRSLPDLLNWGFLFAPGIVGQKDGSLLAGWSFTGPDLDSTSPEALSALSEQLNTTLRQLGSGWMIQVDLLRGRAPAYPESGGFPDPVSALIDEERRQAFLHQHNFDSRQVLLVTWLPPSELAARAASWLTASDQPREDLASQLDLFAKKLDTLETGLAPINPRRLDSPALLTHLHRCLTGLDHEVAVPEDYRFLDYALGAYDLIGGNEPQILGQRIVVLTPAGFPLKTAPALLNLLNHLPHRFRFNARFIPRDAAEMASTLSTLRRNWHQQRFSLGTVLRNVFGSTSKDQATTWVSSYAVEMAQDADAAVNELRSGEIAFGYYTPSLIVHEADPEGLRETVQTLLRELRSVGIPCQVESVNALAAFHGSLPGEACPNVRKPIVSTRNLLHLAPLTSVWTGAAENPNPLFPANSPALLWATTAGGDPFRLNLHVEDVGHTLIVGPTGAGKSALVGLLAVSFLRYSGARVFVFDKGFSSFALTLAVDGQHYDLLPAAGEPLSLRPLARLEGTADLARAFDWLENLFALQGIDLEPGNRTQINHALHLLASSPDRSLTDFSFKLQDLKLRQALGPYLAGGPYGSLFDGPESRLEAAHLTTYEISSLLDYGEAVLAPVLLHLFREIERSLDGRPTLLILEEAWALLGNTRFAKKIGMWLRELRKANAAVVFVTQSLADIAGSPMRSTLFESCPTKILLPNPSAAEVSRAVYESLGLLPGQIELLAKARPKKEYFLHTEAASRLIDLALGPVALSFVGASSAQDRAAISRLRSQHGRCWPAAWLEQRSLRLWAGRLRPLLDERTPQ